MLHLTLHNRSWIDELLKHHDDTSSTFTSVSVVLLSEKKKLCCIFSWIFFRQCFCPSLLRFRKSQHSPPQVSYRGSWGTNTSTWPHPLSAHLWCAHCLHPLLLLVLFSWHLSLDWLPPDAAWQMDRRVSDLWPLSGIADNPSPWKHSGWPLPPSASPSLIGSYLCTIRSCDWRGPCQGPTEIQTN